MFIIECRAVINIWRHSPISFKHVFLWCLLVDPCRTAYQSNLGGLIKKTSHLRPMYLKVSISRTNTSLIAPTSRSSCDWCEMISESKSFFSVAAFLIIFGVCKNIVVIIKVKIPWVINWSYKSIQLSWPYLCLEWLTDCEHMFSLFSTHVFWVSILRFTPNHTPLKCRYPFKIRHYDTLLMKLETMTIFSICNWQLIIAS